MAAPFSFSTASRFSKHFLGSIVYRHPTIYARTLQRHYVTLRTRQHNILCCCLPYDRVSGSNTSALYVMMCRPLNTSVTKSKMTWPSCSLQPRPLQPVVSGRNGLFSDSWGVHCIKQTSNLVTVRTTRHDYVSDLVSGYKTSLPFTSLHVRGLRNVSRDVETETIQQVERLAERQPSESGLTSNEQSTGWLIRLANENGYLSWCRNVYIATVVAVTMYAQDGIIPYAKEAAFTIILLGCLNLLSGTSVFIFNIIRLRSQMLMSRVMALYNCLMALTHLLLWGGAVALFMGFVEENFEEEEDDQEANKDKKKNDKKSIVRKV